MRIRMLGPIGGLILVVVAAGCGGGGSGSTPVTLTIASSLPVGTVNVVYSATLTASGGTSPYVWSTTAGALPKGLTLSSGGVLSGTPTAAGSSTVTIQVADSGAQQGKGVLAATIVVSDGTILITNASLLAQGMLDVAYSSTLSAAGGTPPYAWSVASGSLPAGVTLSPAGVISGLPTAYGTSSFTVQATDSAATPESATAPLVLQVSGGALTITTAALPPGTEGLAYMSQLAAVGGVPPYSWTYSATVPLAAGVAFNASGLLAGTPTGIGDTSPLFTVIDNAGHAASAELNLLVEPAPGTIADGRYAFVFAGTSPQGTPTVINAIAINGTFVLKSGAVLSGFFDSNTNTGAEEFEQPISGGTLTAYANGLGKLVLRSDAGSLTFALAIPPSVAAGSDAAIRMVEFDDGDGSGSRGSGVLKPAQVNSTTAAIQGSFAFLVSGSDIHQHQQALTGSFQTDGNGNILGGLADSNQAGQTFAFPVAAGTTYSVDANGRGTFGLVLCNCPPPGAVVYHYSFYQVSPAEWLTISIDPATLSSPLVSGSVLQQAGSLSNASISGTSVIELNGIASQAGAVVPDITLGLATSDGSANLSVDVDEYNGTLVSGQRQAFTYSVDPPTGRTLTMSSSGPGPKLYIIDGAHAFILGSDSSSSSGTLELQSGAPFTDASFSGNYLGGSRPLVDASVLNEAGIASADGNGGLLLTTSRSDPQGLTQYQNVAGTYSVDGAGRVVATTPDGVTRLFYVVSPGKVVSLTSDEGGYLGSFSQ